MDKPQLDELRREIWIGLEYGEATELKLNVQEIDTPLGGWKSLLLAEGMLHLLQDKGALPDVVDSTFQLLSRLVQDGYARTLAMDGDEEEWAQIYTAAVWMLVLLSGYKPDIKTLAMHCYHVSVQPAALEYQLSTQELLPVVAQAAQQSLGSQWFL